MKIRALLVLPALLVPASALVACGSGGGDFGSDGGSDGGGSGSDGGGGSDGGSDGAGAPTRGGGVYLTSWDYVVAGTPVAGMSASAAFYSAYGTGSSACTTTTDGACQVFDCALGGGADAGTLPPASAGAIHVTGGASPVLLSPSGTSYAAVTAQTRLWNGGEQLDVVADGAEVPAFDLKVTAPSYVTITAPAWPTAGNKVIIARAQPFAVDWSGGGAGNVTVSISTVAGSQSVSLSCSFPASGGAGTVPASALGHLLASAASASISIQSTGVVDAVVSGWGIRVNAQSLAKAGSGTASALATIQ